MSQVYAHPRRINYRIRHHLSNLMNASKGFLKVHCKSERLTFLLKIWSFLEDFVFCDRRWLQSENGKTESKEKLIALPNKKEHTKLNTWENFDSSDVMLRSKKTVCVWLKHFKGFHLFIEGVSIFKETHQKCSGFPKIYSTFCG